MAGQGKRRKTNPARVGGVEKWGVEFRYAFSFRRTTPAKPTSPVPRSVRDPGSGTTVLMLVSPLEIRVDPLKKPLPVLMVICTVAPNTVAPVYHVPLNAPLSV